MRKKNLHLPHHTDYFDESSSPTEEVVLILYVHIRRKFRFLGFILRDCDSHSGLGGSRTCILTSLQVILMWGLWLALWDVHAVQPLRSTAWQYILCLTHHWEPHKASQHSGNVPWMPTVVISQKSLIALPHFITQTLTPDKLNQSPWSLCGSSYGKWRSADK